MRQILSGCALTQVLWLRCLGLLFLTFWSLGPWSCASATPSGLFLALPRVARVAGHRLWPVKRWGRV